MPGFNIENFKGEVSDRNGILKSNRFLMTMVPPPVATLAMSNENETSIGRSLEFWCDSIILPGYQLMMGDVRRWTYGPHEKRPYGPNIISLQTVFLADGDGKMMEFFHSWLNNIIPHYTPQGMTYPAAGAGGLDPYEVRYKSQYATDLHIYVYRDSGNAVLHYVCKEAFPSHVIDTPVSWDMTNRPLKFQVNFEYLDWYMEELPTSTVAKAPGNGAGTPTDGSGDYSNNPVGAGSTAAERIGPNTGPTRRPVLNSPGRREQNTYYLFNR